MTKIWIYDTTLRDGTQGEGVNFSLADKLRIAQRLDAFGVDYIEGGWPGSNPKDAEFFEQVRSLDLKHARVAAFGSTRRADKKVEEDPQIQLLLDAETPVVTIFGKTWDLHVRDVLRTTLDENLRMIEDSVRYLKSHGREVIYDAEHYFDGWKANPDYALETLRVAQEAGADWIVLCDTNGGCLPWEIEEGVRAAQKIVHIPLGIHTHNDSGVAEANSLVAIRLGCTQVQGTINGYGERCGNADLTTVIPNLQIKMGYECVSAEQLAGLRDLSLFVSELANLSPDSHQPFVGYSAFAHKGGAHVNAMVKNEHTYQHVDPALVGNRKRVVVSELSGKDNIAVKRAEFGLDGLDRATERRILQHIKELESRGFAFESAEGSVELLLRRARDDYRRPFELIDYTATVEHRQGRGVISEATVKVRIGDHVFHTAAEGNGPVNALDIALRKALEQFYPQVKKVQLTDYKVRILDSQAATAAHVRVLIDSTDGKRSWGTVGASTNIIEASWQALADSVEYALLKSAEEDQDASNGGTRQVEGALVTE